MSKRKIKVMFIALSTAVAAYAITAAAVSMIENKAKSCALAKKMKKAFKELEDKMA